MMRKWILIILVLIMSMGTASISSAGDLAANGLFLGAGSGALIGQAIGRNTEATLVGTAIGGVLGYIVGNEQEKAYAREPVYTSYGYGGPIYRERYVVRRPTVIYREPAPVFNLSLGWIFNDHRDHQWRRHGHAWRGHDRGWTRHHRGLTRHHRGWRGDHHWRGGGRHR
jgi:hypothetical protein